MKMIPSWLNELFLTISGKTVGCLSESDGQIYYFKRRSRQVRSCPMILAMMIQQKAYRVGSKVKVNTVNGGYSLPEGLSDRAEVVVIAFDIGSRTVKKDGKNFKIPMACIDSGFEPVSASAGRR